MRKKALPILLISTPAIAIIATVVLLLPIYSMTKDDLNGPYAQFVSAWSTNIMPIMIVSLVLMGLGFYLLLKHKP